VRDLEAAFYASATSLTVADLLEMGDIAADEFRKAHPEIAEEGVRALRVVLHVRLHVSECRRQASVEASRLWAAPTCGTGAGWHASIVEVSNADLVSVELDAQDPDAFACPATPKKSLQRGDRDQQVRFPRLSLVFVRHLQNLLSRVTTRLIRVVGGDMRLDILDQRVVGLAFDVRATRTMDDLHVSLLDHWTDRTLPRRG
jgi:hypothetical protein